MDSYAWLRASVLTGDAPINFMILSFVDAVGALDNLTLRNVDGQIRSSG